MNFIGGGRLADTRVFGWLLEELHLNGCGGWCEYQKKKMTCQHEKTLEVSLNLKTAVRLQKKFLLWVHVILHLDSNPAAHTHDGIAKLSAPFLCECWMTVLAQRIQVHPVRNFEVLPYDGYGTGVLSHQSYDGRKLCKLSISKKNDGARIRFIDF